MIAPNLTTIIVSGVTVLTSGILTLSTFFVYVSKRWIDSIEDQVKTNSVQIADSSREIAIARTEKTDMVRRLERMESKIDVLIIKEKK